MGSPRVSGLCQSPITGSTFLLDWAVNWNSMNEQFKSCDAGCGNWRGEEKSEKWPASFFVALFRLRKEVTTDGHSNAELGVRD